MPASVVDATTDSTSIDTAPLAVCNANQALRCDGNNLVRCNADGTDELSVECLLGCSAAELRCKDVAPSNGLAPLLDLASQEPDLDLSPTATINTDNGSVIVNGVPVAVRNALLAQVSAPSIEVLVVRSLVAANVTVTGSNALAIVSHGDLRITGVVSVSAPAAGGAPGPGAFSDGACDGGSGAQMQPGMLIGGAGGGGFGAKGGGGGTARNNNGVIAGGAGGAPTGNAELVPLRGGCRGGLLLGVSGTGGRGGGAIQLVSRTKISISGAVAANGGAAGGGGGSGGGILLEAPLVDIAGAVVANGAGGTSGCFLSEEGQGQPGRLDAMHAPGGSSCNASTGAGGSGGAQDFGGGGFGGSIDQSGTGVLASGGYGGGSVGRIRVNTVGGGLHTTGLFSPNPTTGTVATR